MAAGLLFVVAFGAGESAVFGDLHPPKGRSLGCDKKQIEQAECDTVTRQVMMRSEHVMFRRARPVYQSIRKPVVAQPGAVQWTGKNRNLLDREEVMCKIEVPAVVRNLDMCLKVNDGERAEQHVPAVNPTESERVLARPEGSRWIKSHTGC